MTPNTNQKKITCHMDQFWQDLINAKDELRKKGPCLSRITEYQRAREAVWNATRGINSAVKYAKASGEDVDCFLTRK